MKGFQMILQIFMLRLMTTTEFHLARKLFNAFNLTMRSR